MDREGERDRIAEVAVETSAAVAEQSATDGRPYVGAMVMYVGSGDAVSSNNLPQFAAVIVDVNPKDVNLQVFGTMRVFPRCNVTYDPEKSPNTWHWRVDEEK